MGCASYPNLDLAEHPAILDSYEGLSHPDAKPELAVSACRT